MPVSPSDSWRAVAQRHWPQYVAVAAMLLLLAASDWMPPHQAAMYGGSDREFWRYSFPTRGEALPDATVPLLTVALPLLVLAAARLLGCASRAEVHAQGLALLACVAAAGLAANLLKTQVGHPRPDFVHRCWPHTAPRFGAASLPACEAGVDAHKLARGRRSFPSGHATWSGAGLGFLSLWLSSKLRAAGGGGAQPAQLMLALLPLAGALAIGVQRYVADKHHVTDVAFGLAVGLMSALLFYRQACASLQPGGDAASAEAEGEEDEATEVSASHYLGAGSLTTQPSEPLSAP